MKALAVPLVVPLAAALAAAACGSTGSGVDATEEASEDASVPRASDAEAAAPSVARADWDPLAMAVSPCGRYRLRLEHAEWREEPGARPQLSLQFALRTGEADVLLCDRARVSDLVPSDGTEFRFDDLKGTGRAHPDAGTLAFHGLEVYRRDDRLRRLRVEARLLRVFSWTSYDISCTGLGDRAEFVCAPYSVVLSGNAALPDMCTVGVSILSNWRDLPAHQRDLVGGLGHEWVATSAALADAQGRELYATLGGGTGGFTSASYGPSSLRDPADVLSRPTISWPVRGRIRVPERYVLELVPFEFADCALSRR